jgi:lysophospholipase L1-like esterase
VASIGTAARDMKVAVFRRFAVMQHWVSSGQYQMDEVVARDGLHLNDVSYGCIARLLADSLTAAAQAVPPPEEGAAAPDDTPGAPAPR